MLVNTLSAIYEYCRNNTDNLPLPVHKQLSGKVARFSAYFFIAFFESGLNFEEFEKNFTLIAQVFPKLLTPKDVCT